MTNEDFREAYSELGPNGRAATFRYLSERLHEHLEDLRGFHGKRKVTVEEAIQVHGAYLTGAFEALANLYLALAIEQEEKQ